MRFLVRLLTLLPFSFWERRCLRFRCLRLIGHYSVELIPLDVCFRYLGRSLSSLLFKKAVHRSRGRVVLY